MRVDSASRIVLAYVMASGLWILGSDRLLHLVAPDQATASRLQSAKGLFFVFVTALMLYALIRRSMVTHERSMLTLRSTIEGMVDGVFILDREHRVTDVNQAAVDLIGAESRSAILRPMSEVATLIDPRDLHDKKLEISELPITQALRGVSLSAVEAKIRRRDGRERFVSINAAPIRWDKHGDALAVVMTLRDVTSVRELEALRSEFIQRASHEMKTPITVIQANFELLQRPTVRQDEQQLQGIFQAVDRQCRRIDRLVNELVDVTRLDRGFFVLRKAKFNLVDLVEQAVRRIRSSMDRKHWIEFEVSDPIWIDADRDRIEQVILNLLDNGIRYSPAGGAVRVSVCKNGPLVEVRVKDQGIGIPEKSHSGVFGRYFRPHAGTAMDLGGLGIGLSLNREIIHRHGGAMGFSSEEGRGSEFWFSLPLPAAEERPY